MKRTPTRKMIPRMSARSDLAEWKEREKLIALRWGNVKATIVFFTK